MDWDQLSAVIIGSSLREPQFHRAQASHYTAIVNALETFEARGYKRPCLLIHSEVDERTHRAYTAAFQAWGHPMKRVWQANTHESEGLEAWLKKTKPDVIMADWDLWYQAIPDKIKASCGFLSLSVRNREGSITGIHQNTASIAKCSVDLLVRARLQHELGEPQEPVLMLTVGSWIEGSTLKALAPIKNK